jgi:hypothetical protein
MRPVLLCALSVFVVCVYVAMGSRAYVWLLRGMRSMDCLQHGYKPTAQYLDVHHMHAGLLVGLVVAVCQASCLAVTIPMAEFRTPLGCADKQTASLSCLCLSALSAGSLVLYISGFVVRVCWRVCRSVYTHLQGRVLGLRLLLNCARVHRACVLMTCRCAREDGQAGSGLLWLVS